MAEEFYDYEKLYRDPRYSVKFRALVSYLEANGINFNILDADSPGDPRSGVSGDRIGTNFRDAISSHLGSIEQVDPALRPPLSGDAASLAFNVEGQGSHGEVTTISMNEISRELLGGSKDPVIWIRQSAVGDGKGGHQYGLRELVANTPELRVLSTSTAQTLSNMTYGAAETQDTLGFWSKAGENGKIPFFAAGNAGDRESTGNNLTFRNFGLPVSVAAGYTGKDGKFVLESYSTADVSATIVGHALHDPQIIWRDGTDITYLSGTSSATPYVSSNMQHLMSAYGSHLSSQQILYALMATADPVAEREVSAQLTYDYKQGEKTRPLDHMTTARGFMFDPDYSGYGMINLSNAEKLLQHMVAQTQQAPEKLTNGATQEQSLSMTQPPVVETSVDTQGKEKKTYTYNFDFGDGAAMNVGLKLLYQNQPQVLRKQFAEKAFGTLEEGYIDHGELYLESPDGTRIPLHPTVPKTVAYGGDMDLETNRSAFAQTFAMAGEATKGQWKLVTTEPLEQATMQISEVGKDDLIRDLTAEKVRELVNTPVPDVSKAKPKDQLWTENGMADRVRPPSDFLAPYEAHIRQLDSERERHPEPFFCTPEREVFCAEAARQEDTGTALPTPNAPSRSARGAAL